jgi:peptidoglycan/LPS O-acetylase OafA/YrhL
MLSSLKRIAFGLWLVFFPFLVLLWYYPSSTTSTRYATVGVLSVIIVGLIVFSWKKRILRWGLLALYAIIAAFLLIPFSPREGDAAKLRGSIQNQWPATRAWPTRGAVSAPRGSIAPDLSAVGCSTHL